MNNYNSLGAVMAGINSLSVHRLALTRSLVSETAHRHYMSLELLMGTHKSHSAYRLAWENTFSKRIPFIPLHRRDLVSADEGNRTFMEDGLHINWRKFEVMGDMLVLILNSQSIPFGEIPASRAAGKLIMETTVCMNDDVSKIENYFNEN